MKKKILIHLLLLLVICGCTRNTEYRYFNGHLEDLRKTTPYIGTFKRIESKNTLLEFYTFSGGFPVPSFGGYSLFIEGPASFFRSKTEIQIPDKYVTVTYYHDYHHIGRFENNFVGNIRVVESTNDFLAAAIDVTNKDTGKRLEIRGKFKLTPVSKFNEVER